MPPQYMFLTYAWYSAEWWKVNSENLTCTVKQRESILTTTLAFQTSQFLDEVEDANLTTTPGIVSLAYIIIMHVQGCKKRL